MHGFITRPFMKTSHSLKLEFRPLIFTFKITCFSIAIHLSSSPISSQLQSLLIILFCKSCNGVWLRRIFYIPAPQGGIVRACMRVPPRHSLRTRGSRFHCRKPKPRFPLELPLSPVAAAGVPLLPTASGRHARRVRHLTSTVVPGLPVQRHSG